MVDRSIRWAHASLPGLQTVVSFGNAQLAIVATLEVLDVKIYSYDP